MYLSSVLKFFGQNGHNETLVSWLIVSTIAAECLVGHFGSYLNRDTVCTLVKYNIMNP